VRPVLAVNLSSINLHDSEFPQQLQRLMEKWALDPAYLQLEITESAMMADAERAHRTLDQIHALGVELAIDDFGTGFSSLTYLKHLPVSKLKIDKSFVISMLQDENDAVIVRSTIDMAHNLGMKVVAEGVENQETYDLLEILDCDIIQGYLISKPLDIASLEQWIPLQQKLAMLHTPLHANYHRR
jgi:EAL domain-containing protein (putative c-di-GMP-specific phosphodiesterase class I)